MDVNSSPIAETLRLEALQRYEVLNSAPEQAFDDLTWLASKIAQTPIAAISLVDADRLWFKSKIGLDLDCANRQQSFCDYGIRTDEPLTVTNALEDERFRDSPMVSGPLGIRFYLGIPLIIPNGHRIGTLCVIDTVPRHPQPETVNMISTLARQVVHQLEYRISARKLKHAVAEAQRANQAKSNFLANMSHEIRTPLNGILGMTDLLMVSPKEHKKKHNLEVIRDSGDKLLRLIDEILDLSKVEAGKIQLEHVNFDIRRRISNMAQTFEDTARKKGIALTVSLPENMPQSVLGDPVRLDQILCNLMGNAVKFTTAGEVRFSASVVEIKDAEVTIKMEVADTGVGIPGEKLETIFEAFNQGDASTTRRYGGNGLGLAIVSRLVDLMGGVIQVQTKVGQGSTFCLTIPFRASIDELHTNSPDGSNPAAGTSVKGRILLVDDNRINLKVTHRMLIHLGHKCTIASSGRQAIDLFESQSFDLVLMDIQMPEIDGFQTTTMIRQMEHEHGWAPTPIVALTAHSMKGDREQCLATGMNGFLAKPITLRVLSQTLIEQMTER